ncbi:hypothetical protein SADUNF_Sadunf17G0093100 [Salix dunnii]|uniref:Uncharacterized protein n=1 Tax=Salix dunnii TaxID=1413687 RepID=A0A835MNH5_9ROSI|nr:hypothetical protein SADUNF_Sadunf17G0093100 [Salix dunnii]
MNSESKLESAMEYKGRSPSIAGSEMLAPQLFELSSSSIIINDDDNVRAADKERLLIVSLLCFASSSTVMWIRKSERLTLYLWNKTAVIGGVEMVIR